MTRKMTILISAVLIAILILFVAVLTSCTVQKRSFSSTKDSISTTDNNRVKKDSTTITSVNTSDKVSKSDYEWWRTIFEKPGKIDTVYRIDKDGTPIIVHQPPARVIIEGGKGNISEQTNTKDSITLNSIISEIESLKKLIATKEEVTEKDKKSSGIAFGIQSIILLVIGGYIALRVLETKGSAFISNFSNLKKSNHA